MLKNLLLLASLVVFSAPAYAIGNAWGWCEQGGQKVVTPGSQQSTTYVQRSYTTGAQGCTVTVYFPGTTNLVSIFSNNSSTPKANPFIANANGYWSFYAESGRYDVQLSGAGLPAPITIGPVMAFDISQFLPNILTYGAKCDGTSDDSPAFVAALLATTSIGLPVGRTCVIANTVVIDKSNVTIFCPVPATPDVWRAEYGGGVVPGQSPCRLKDTVNGAAFEVRPGIGQGIDSVKFTAIDMDGRDAGTDGVGVWLNASAAGSFIEGVNITDIKIKNHKRNDVRINGNVFIVQFDNFSSHDFDITASGSRVLVCGNPGIGFTSQIKFRGGVITPNTPNTWAIDSGNGDVDCGANATSDIYLIGTTISPNCITCFGVRAHGGITSLANHYEGAGTGGTGILLQYSGTNGFTSSGDSIANAHVGLSIGDPNNKSSAATSVFVTSNIIGNGTDVVVQDGGARGGNLAMLNAASTISNLRNTTDGVYGEILDLSRSDYNRGAVNVVGAINMYTTNGITNTNTAAGLPLTSASGSIFPVHVPNNNPAKVGFMVRGAAAQTSALYEAQNDSGTVNWQVEADGREHSLGIIFANLGSVVGGQFGFCPDCTVTSGSNNACVGGGNGAFFFGINGVWRCFNAQN